MTRFALFRSLAVAVGAISLATACGGGPSTPSENLAADQTLRFAIIDQPTSPDPAHVDSAVDITFLSEVFTGLSTSDNTLKIISDGTTGMPDISADGKTWTFKLRKDMQFSNGDKITAKDCNRRRTRTSRR